MVARGSPKAKVAGSSPVLLDTFSFCDFGTKSGEALSFGGLRRVPKFCEVGFGEYQRWGIGCSKSPTAR